MTPDRKPLSRAAPSVPTEVDPDVERMRNAMAEIRRWTIEGTHPRLPQDEAERERLRSVLHEVQQWVIEGLHRASSGGAS